MSSINTATTATSALPLNQLSNDSPSFSFLEYFLRLSMHASTVRICSAWEVSNPQLTLQFEKRAKDLLTLDSWLDVSNLPLGNSEEETVKKGFQFTGSTGGMKFTMGRIKIGESEGGNSDGANQVGGVIRKRMLLCKVAVGRAYNATEELAKVATIPEGYDSFVIDRDAINLNSIETSGKSSKEPVDWEYIVKDPAQLLPTFVVVFEFDPEIERRSRQKSRCDNCEDKPATIFCQADAANLCQECDAALHSTKLTTRHVRTALEAGPQTFSMCRQHSDKYVEFFCPTCSRPVCVHCKMVGHHSTGEAARHKLITVAEAFKGVSEAARAADPLLEARRQKIGAQMAAVVERTKAVESNAAEVQQQLEEIYKKALNDLKSITKRKVNILKGDMVELHRESAEISHLDSFLSYQASGGNACQFILDWGAHQKLRGELHSFPHHRENIDVLPDIRINGGIQIHVEASGPPPSPLGGAGGTTYDGDNVMRGSALFDRPRYMHSPSKSRNGTPLMDFSNLTKASRKPTSEVETILGNSTTISPLTKA